MTVTVLLVALLASGALFYFRQTSEDVRQSMAREQMLRVRDEIDRWTLAPGRPYPSSLADLKRLPADDLADPWGTLYSFQPAARRLISAGPNQVFDTPDDVPDPVLDDLIQKLPDHRLPPPRPIK